MARILAVDDDPDSLSLIEASLRRAGHEVSTCGSPGEVAAFLEQAGFDAVVLDINMPEVSGFEVLRSLRRGARTREIPVLLLSIRDRSSDRVRGLREGADDYLAKPFEPEELALRVEKIVAARRARGALAGDLEIYPVWDLLQSLTRTGRSGTVLMVAEERSAELYLLEGRLIEARVGPLSGEEAMLAALDFERGSFRFFEGDLLGGVSGRSGEGLDAASIVLRHALRAATLGAPIPAVEEELGARLEAALGALYDRVRTQRRSSQNLHLLLLASPSAWGALVDLVRRVPARLSLFDRAGLDDLERRRGGSWMLQHPGGPVALHLHSLEGGAQRQASQDLPLCAGVLVWAEGASALAEAAPLLGALERSSWGQAGVLIVPPELCAAPPLSPRGWRALAAPPADLAAALAALVSAG